MESIIVFLIRFLIAAASFAKAKKAKKTGTNAKTNSKPLEPSVKKTQASRKSTKEIQPKPQTIQQKGPEVSVSEGESLYSADQQGSLAFESFEGEDICDPSLAHGIAMIDRAQENNDTRASAYSAFSFDANAVRNGFVMSEIINEPAWKRMHRKA